MCTVCVCMRALLPDLCFVAAVLSCCVLYRISGFPLMSVMTSLAALVQQASKGMASGGVGHIPYNDARRGITKFSYGSRSARKVCVNSA
jgi:hypothetical protein